MPNTIARSYGRSLLPVKQGSGLYYGQAECKRYRKLNFNLKVKEMPNGYANEERFLSTPLYGLQEWRYPK
ncbi:hypothetical protein Tco_1575511 [Tanacetum coccineum]